MPIVDLTGTPRERAEELERTTLSAWGTLAGETKGRDRLEDLDPLRTAFQIDRDRVAGCRAFRRLWQKSTGLPLGWPARRTVGEDTVEVALLARTVARGQRLNEDLVAAIALARDFGRAPFGVAGEAALGGVASAAFEHADQSLRMVEQLEDAGRGLNLTWETRDGVVHHGAAHPGAGTPEGQLVGTIARFTARSHDLDDALNAGLLQPADLPARVAALGATHKDRVDTLIRHLAARVDGPEVGLDKRTAGAAEQLDQLMAARVDNHPTVLAAAEPAVHCLRSLTVYFLEHPGSLPPTADETQPLEVQAVDAVAGMVDAEARSRFIELFTPAT
jgi:dGTPase